MPKAKLLAALLAVSAAGLLALPDAALAQQKKVKKLTYEQAWAACKKEVDTNVAKSDTVTTAARFSAGGACMKRHGYRLKKGTPI